ncbi:MAG: hypothetical protein ACI8PP_001777 [Candidatus Pseudothioglobus sp.]|jgi:hypothetical protein
MDDMLLNNSIQRRKALLDANICVDIMNYPELGMA